MVSMWHYLSFLGPTKLCASGAEPCMSPSPLVPENAWVSPWGRCSLAELSAVCMAGSRVGPASASREVVTEEARDSDSCLAQDTSENPSDGER